MLALARIHSCTSYISYVVYLYYRTRYGTSELLVYLNHYLPANLTACVDLEKLNCFWSILRVCSLELPLHLHIHQWIYSATSNSIQSVSPGSQGTGTGNLFGRTRNYTILTTVARLKWIPELIITSTSPNDRGKQSRQAEQCDSRLAYIVEQTTGHWFLKLVAMFSLFRRTGAGEINNTRN
jgi:hypothetical protein